MKMSTTEPSVVWLGKERVNKLGGEWSFLSIGSLKAAWAPHADIICAGFTYVRVYIPLPSLPSFCPLLRGLFTRCKLKLNKVTRCRLSTQERLFMIKARTLFTSTFP